MAFELYSVGQETGNMVDCEKKQKSTILPTWTHWQIPYYTSYSDMNIFSGQCTSRKPNGCWLPFLGNYCVSWLGDLKLTSQPQCGLIMKSPVTWDSELGKKLGEKHFSCGFKSDDRVTGKPIFPSHSLTTDVPIELFTKKFMKKWQHKFFCIQVLRLYRVLLTSTSSII